jgi:hypothetical protein
MRIDIALFDESGLVCRRAIDARHPAPLDHQIRTKIPDCGICGPDPIEVSVFLPVPGRRFARLWVYRFARQMTRAE